MNKLLEICNDLLEGKICVEDLKKNSNDYNIFPDSIYEKDNSTFFMVKIDKVKKLIILGEDSLLDSFDGELILSNRGKICALNHRNSQALRRTFPFTAPISSKGYMTSIGLGDRLGLASIGHLKVIKEYNIFPVLAQQSTRELTLTKRSYDDVLDSATWSVFQENYQLGFGADGDHLKTMEEVKMALDCGFTMITLDCSEYIDNSIFELNDSEVLEKYSKLDELTRNDLETRYLGKKFSISESDSIIFNEVDFKKNILIYHEAIIFMIKIFNELIAPLGDKIDFEISVDETLFSTSIEAHFLIASELIRSAVKISSLAPRFVGEFQKGIDYIGVIKEFENDFYRHYQLAEHFNYKLSVHSGSDKFDIFPIIGDVTKGKYHLKTAGTNWLEAMRVISVVDSRLFREIFEFALNNLEAAKVYYHINGDAHKIPVLDEIKDDNLVNLLDNDDAGQILHITYGLILQYKNDKDEYIFKDKIYDLLNNYEDVYSEFLYKHIGNHLEGLKLSKILQ